ncbi:hypothetical protein KP509_31G010900 [Ceratopteris richardii]|uniref:Uncharacterized protein n=1 Tax=Ceratopteris richardii TaxID=49495 RepID=A0A8T2QXL7_CERRI|nr:hypothetical protein KP509_31G010900 [Ceratopteris richardii]
MVATDIPPSATQQEDSHISMAVRHSSGSQNEDVFDVPETIMENSAPYVPHMNLHIPVIEKENGLHVNGSNQCLFTCAQNANVYEDPKTEMEGFIMRDHDIDVIKESLFSDINSTVKGLPDDHGDMQSIMSNNYGVQCNENDCFAQQRRRVLWNDNHGKDLVQVHEYEASDTGDSDEEDDEADAHACACTIQ